MRFTRKGGAIDQEKANRELKLALDLGVNYFDTAYIYQGSEAALGSFIETYGCRDRINIATKLPQYRVKRALELGVNYFDTAYIYQGSEAALGSFIETYGCRDSINIATKLPQYRVKRAEDFDAYFDEELKRLRTDYVDYYLMHMMNDAQSWQRLCDLGIREWIARKKQAGQIRNIGFSFHGEIGRAHV